MDNFHPQTMTKTKIKTKMMTAALVALGMSIVAGALPPASSMPDLWIHSVGRGSGYVCNNTEVEFVYNVQNKGTATASSSVSNAKVYAYISATSTAEKLVCNQSYTDPALAPNQFSQHLKLKCVSTSTPQVKWSKVVATTDVNRAVAESNENNNVRGAWLNCP